MNFWTVDIDMPRISNALLVWGSSQILAPVRADLPQLACTFVSTRRRLIPRSNNHSQIHSSSSTMDGRIDATAGNNDNMGTGTRYRVTSMLGDENRKRIRISFDSIDDTTAPTNIQVKEKSTNAVGQRETAGDKRMAPPIESQKGGDSHAEESVPESVLQYQRQMRKIKAADRASKTNVNVHDHLRCVYSDDHVVVTNKPSGILCVPGVNKYKSLLDLVYEVYGNADAVEGGEGSPSSPPPIEPLPRDSMIVHRLDMDTSGIVIFARTRLAMSKLHESFRERTGTKKIYEALLVGWLDIGKWTKSEGAEETGGDGNLMESPLSNDENGDLGGGEIHLPLQRDHRHPPFMRVSTPESEAQAREAVKDLNSAGYKKLMAKKPKPSTTQFCILSHEKWMGFPVTRVELTPITGRTHQLRVHCAALGHPILGDPAYGFCGEAHPNGGFTDEVVRRMSPTCATFELRRDVEDAVQENGRVMCLHARKLTLEHPVKKEEVSFEAIPSF